MMGRMASPLYKPRPEPWPQFTLRGLLIVTMLAGVLSATVLPKAYWEWRLRGVRLTPCPTMPHCQEVHLFTIEDNRTTDGSIK